MSNVNITLEICAQTGIVIYKVYTVIIFIKSKYPSVIVALGCSGWGLWVWFVQFDHAAI